MQKLPIVIHFIDQLDEQVQAVRNASTIADNKNALANTLDRISKEAIVLGDVCAQELIDQKRAAGQEILPYCYVHFSWMEEIKSFLILVQNMLFETQKAIVLLADKKVNEQQVSALQKASDEVLLHAAADLLQSYDNGVAAIEKDPKKLKQYIEHCALQNEPWTAYKTQLETFPKHGKLLLEQSELLTNAQTKFADIERLIDEAIAANKARIEAVEEQAKEIIVFIQESVDVAPSKVAHELEHKDIRLPKSANYSIFEKKVEEDITPLLPEKTSLIVSTNAGILQAQDINLHSSVEEWIDAEILPLLLKLGEISEGITNDRRITLSNIRNRALLLSNENVNLTDESTVSIAEPLTLLLNNIQKIKTNFAEIVTEIERNLATYFKVSAVFSVHQPFLPVPFQATINKYRISQTEWWSQGLDWIKGQTNRIERLKKSVEQEEALSVSEKIVRYIESRKPEVNNTTYANIFLTKGFVGNAFLFGRSRELKHIRQLKKQWKMGYRGAVLLHGKRWSGKTVFGDMAALRFFPQKTILLAPNMTLNVAGRKFTPTYDLGEALRFVTKYAATGDYLVRIDDLELWKDATHTISRNLRLLCDVVDTYSHKIFFMVSMSNWTKAHFNKGYELDKVFQSFINLDGMSEEAIRQAILTRHGATHKTLTNLSGTEVSPEAFQKMIEKVSQAADGSVGDALNLWAASIQKKDDNRVVFRFKSDYDLPDFVNADNAILLTTLMMNKRISEYELRKLYGTAFNAKYNAILHRLLSVGLLSRDAEGILEVNEIAANEVGKLLKAHQFIAA